MLNLNKNIFREGNVKVQEGTYTSLNLNLVNIKGLSGKIEIPFKNDVYGIVGSNGSGKSTIMSILSRLVPPYTFRFTDKDYTGDSVITYSVYDKCNEWNFKSGRSTRTDQSDEIRVYGRYEGSLFYGTRFEDSSNVDYLMQTGKITGDVIVDADQYVVESLGYILHDNKNYYKGLKRLKNRQIAKELNIKNLPYFYEINNYLISQYRMSSGECLLISLLHFLYNSIIRKSIPVNHHALLLIDEIELALHPVAVKRLIELLIALSQKSGNLTCIISSHSLEVIRSVSPNNIFNLKVNFHENGNRYFVAENPSYPCYLMKDIYSHNGYDFVILVEDCLAAKVVEKSLIKLQLRQNKLICVIPVGGWSNVYDLHNTLSRENTLGVSTKIISIIDGDVKSEATKKFNNLPHMFLPVASVEKFLLTNLITESKIKKCIKDTFFVGKSSIDDFMRKYLDKEEILKKDCEKRKEKFEDDKNGKRLYRMFKNFCETERKISEDSLVDVLFHIIEQNINLNEFESSLLCEIN